MVLPKSGVEQEEPAEPDDKKREFSVTRAAPSANVWSLGQPWLRRPAHRR